MTVFSQIFSAASVDSGPQEHWTGLILRGRKKGSTTQQQGSSRLSQPRARVLRGQRPEAMEEEESSPVESDSSDQGEAVAPFTRLLQGGKFFLLFHLTVLYKRYVDGMRGHPQTLTLHINKMMKKMKWARGCRAWSTFYSFIVKNKGGKKHIYACQSITNILNQVSILRWAWPFDTMRLLFNF